MCLDDKAHIIVRLAVTVKVDPTDDELLDRFDAANGEFSVGRIVGDEIKSNLESVSYVRHVSVERVERR